MLLIILVLYVLLIVIIVVFVKMNKSYDLSHTEFWSLAKEGNRVFYYGDPPRKYVIFYHGAVFCTYKPLVEPSADISMTRLDDPEYASSYESETERTE